MRRVAIVVAAAVVAMVVGAAASRADVVTHARGRPRATVLMLHPGAYLFGDARVEQPFADRFAAAGFRVVALDYPLGNVPAAERYAARAVRRYRAAFAVGQSAGGTLAAYLDVRGLVRAAVDVSGPTDFLTFPELWRGWWREIGLRTVAARRAASPATLCCRRQAPLMEAYSPQDRVVPYSQARRLEHARLVVLHGDHLTDPSWVAPAVEFLKAGSHR